MSFIQIETPRLQINIPDLVKDETVIKRTATLFNMNYNQSSKELVLQWNVKHYSNDSGQLGEYLGKVIPDWTKETIADNTTMCDASNGHPIEKIDTGEKDEQDNPIMDYDQNIPYMGQYDFFYQLAGNQPILVHPMIIQFGGLVQSWDKK